VSVYEASVQQAFTASHSVPLPAGGAEESHKHTWVITATFRARRLDETMAVVIDFVAAQQALEAIAAALEGGDLNQLPEFIDGRASAERVAEILAGRLVDQLSNELAAPEDGGPWLSRLALTEAPGCSAAYLPFDGK